MLVDRCACQKGCTGPVLRAIQRFGKLGKRAWGTVPSPDITDRTNNNMKVRAGALAWPGGPRALPCFARAAPWRLAAARWLGLNYLLSFLPALDLTSPLPLASLAPSLQDPRYFYLSFDEAGTHVGVKTFRLVVAVYDQGGRRRLAECVSPPVRVLANNDVPTGAAHIMLHAQIP